MSEEVKIKQYGLTIDFSSDVDYHLRPKFAEAIEKQIQDGVAAAAAKFEEDFFLGAGNIGKKMNAKKIDALGMRPEVGSVKIVDADQSLKTPRENVSLYKEGDWSIARNRYLGLYILYKGQALMCVANDELRKIEKVPDHIRAKWKFLCEMDK